MKYVLKTSIRFYNKQTVHVKDCRLVSKYLKAGLLDMLPEGPATCQLQQFFRGFFPVIK